jgi:predicted metal-dependent hydrolase
MGLERLQLLMAKAAKPQLRQADDICYTLTYKKVRNINLRVGRDGSVLLSAPRRLPVEELDRFVSSHSEWIAAAQARMRRRLQKAEQPIPYSDSQCLEIFTSISDQFYPLFSSALPEKPVIRIRLMKSRWGSCCPTKRTITLNKRLLCYPQEAVEYVVLHEYVHFLHPDHQKGFYETLSRLMPDYARRRALLRE